jgi:hypothetical protein
MKNSPVVQPPGSCPAYLPEFQIIKTSLKETIIQKLPHLVSLQPYEMKVIF